MRVAVTGSTGHIGSVLVRRLVEDGHQVRALTFGPDEVLADLPVERIEADVCDRDALRVAFRDVEVVFHLAAFISVRAEDEPLMRAVNVDGVRNAAEAALSAGVRRFVHVSSVHAYETWRLGAPLVEDAPRALGSQHPAYDRSKADGERELREVIARGLDAVILNPVGVVGPGDHRPSLMGGTLKQMYRGRMRLLPEGGFCWVDVRDVVDAAVRAIDRGEVGHNYLISGGYLSTYQFQQVAMRKCGRSAWAVVLPLPLLQSLYRFTWHIGLSRLFPPGFTADALYTLDSQLVVDTTRARTALGFEPRCLEAAIGDTIDWWQEHGQLA